MSLLLLMAALLSGVLAFTPDRDRSELEAQYAAAPSRFVQVAGLRLHVRDSGPADKPDAPVLVLLHGFASSLHTWEDWAQTLQADHRVIRLDLPGAGLTGPDTANVSDTPSDERNMAVLMALLDELGVARATLVGHSAGGRLAWRFAAQWPERVNRLVLAAPAGFADNAGDKPAAGSHHPVVNLLRYVLPKPLLRQALASVYANPAMLTEETVTRYHDMLLAPGVRAGLLARKPAAVQADPAPFLARITVPTLVLWGQEDKVIPPAHAQRFAAALPQAQVILLPDVGHVPHEEAPQATLQVLRQFLMPCPQGSGQCH